MIHIGVAVHPWGGAALGGGFCGAWRRARAVWGGRGPGIPAKAERAVDQGLVAADRDVGADLDVGPAQLVFDLFVALLNRPVPCQNSFIAADLPLRAR